MFDRRMLEAYCEQRDYGKALEVAKHLSKDEFGSWRHQDRAIKLAKQLPRRSGEDFKTLTLPTAKEWAALKQKLDRKQQVEYLTRRIRLMHCQQLSNPGSISYTQDQYREPYTWGMKVKPAQVINPFNGLLNMNLNGGDLLVMVPYLLSEDYILGYDLYRFLPQGPRNLHSVQWVVANIICETAQEGIVNFRLLGGEDEGAKKKHVADVREWCIRNEKTTIADRLLARITDEGTDWEEVKRTFWNLYNLEEVRACAAVYKMGQQREKRMPEVIQLLCLLGRKEYVGHAHEWAKSDSEATRFYAALLLFQHGDRTKREGLDVLMKAVKSGHTVQIHAALEPLLARKDAEVKKALLALLGKDAPKAFVLTLPFLQRMVLAGHEEAFQMVDALLSGKADFKCYGDLRGREEPLKEATGVAAYIRYGWQPEAEQMEMPWDAPKADRERNLKHVRTWLEKQWQLIQAGKKSNIQKVQLTVDWGDWLTRSSGWIRRF
jgi:hypothetical protein